MGGEYTRAGAKDHGRVQREADATGGERLTGRQNKDAGAGERDHSTESDI